MNKNDSEIIIRIIILITCIFILSVIIFSYFNNSINLKKNIEVQNKPDNKTDMPSIEIPSVKKGTNEYVPKKHNDMFAGNWEEPEMGRYGVKISKKDNDYFVTYYGSNSATDYRETILKCFLDDNQKELICNGGVEIEHYAVCNGYHSNIQEELENYYVCEQQGNTTVKEKTDKVQDNRTWIISIKAGGVLENITLFGERNIYDEYEDMCLNMINDDENIECRVFKKKE